MPFALKGHADGVARGAGQVKRHQPLLAQPGVDECGFAHVRAPRHGEANHALALLWRVFIFRRLFHAQRIKRRFQHGAHTAPVRGGKRQHLAQPKLVKLRQIRAAAAQPLGLVRAQHAGLAELAQIFGNLVVLRREARAHIHQKNHHIGFRHGLPRLPRHFAVNAALVRLRLKAASVNGDKRAPPQPPSAVVPVARQPRKVGNDGVPAAREAVEQRGLAHIRAPHEGDDGGHGSGFPRMSSMARGLTTKSSCGKCFRLPVTRYAFFPARRAASAVT